MGHGTDVDTFDGQATFVPFICISNSLEKEIFSDNHVEVVVVVCSMYSFDISTGIGEATLYGRLLY